MKTTGITKRRSQELEARPSSELTRREMGRPAQVLVPACDIYETDDELCILAELPGVTKEGLEVRFENGELAIVGRMQEPAPTQGRSLLQEFEPAQYYRAFGVTEAVDKDRIEAELQDGILTVHLPKLEAVKPRRIPVQMRT